jgi:hypothetical protein
MGEEVDKDKLDAELREDERKEVDQLMDKDEDLAGKLLAWLDEHENSRKYGIRDQMRNDVADWLVVVGTMVLTAIELGIWPFGNH